MASIFVDTGYFIALELDDDQDHEAAKRHWESVSQDHLDLVTTSLVLIETVTFINSRGYHSNAVSVGNMLLTSPSIHLIHVDEALLMDGWEYFRGHSDKIYSLTDCVSFIVMERYRIYTAYAFDRDFNRAGFATEPLRL